MLDKEAESIYLAQVMVSGGRLGRRCSPFIVWIWLVPRRAGNSALRREEICTEIVGMEAIITVQEITLT